jgi:fucose permease
MRNDVKVRVLVYLLNFIFAILLNSVGILIQRSINLYGVTYAQAGYLEGFKDLSIALVSFIAGSALPRLGYRKGLLIGLGLVLAGCLIMYAGNAFWAVKVMFACTGFAFALVKVAVYALISSASSGQHQLNRLLSTVESVFMVGIATAYIVFPLFYSDDQPGQWLRVYLLLSALILAAMLLVLVTDFGPYQLFRQEGGVNYRAQLQLLRQPMVLAFAASAFLYVMTEQGIMSWLPTFNKEVLQLPESTSIQMAVILSLTIALGRLASGYLSRYVPWVHLLLGGLAVAAAMIALVLPLTTQMAAPLVRSIRDVPLIAFVFPCIGLFLAPVYPLMSGAVLSATSRQSFTQMAGVMTFFSAIGGTLGSQITGRLFQYVGGDKAFYFALLPMALLALSLWALHQHTRHAP